MPGEEATGCWGKMKVGLAKGLVGGTVGLGAGEKERGEEGFSGVEAREEMSVVVVHESVSDFGGVLFLGTAESLGGRGG